MTASLEGVILKGYACCLASFSTICGWGEQALKDSSFAELDNVPDHVVHNVHGTQGVKLVSGDIWNIVEEAALPGTSDSSEPSHGTRSQRKYDTLYVQFSASFQTAKTNWG